MLQQLKEMPPDQFEHLIGQLVEKMGYKAIVTRYSQDGGVDVVANRNDGLTTQRVLIQAKRYSGTVGLSTVRDLYGVLASDQQATSAIIVTTGTFSTQARKFTEGKRIELLDGERLVQLLAQYSIVNVPAIKPSTSRKPVSVSPVKPVSPASHELSEGGVTTTEQKTSKTACNIVIAILAVMACGLCAMALFSSVGGGGGGGGYKTFTPRPTKATKYKVLRTTKFFLCDRQIPKCEYCNEVTGTYAKVGDIVEQSRQGIGGGKERLDCTDDKDIRAVIIAVQKPAEMWAATFWMPESALKEQ